MDEDGFDAASKAKKMRPDEDSVKAKKQLTVKFGFGKKKKGATGKDIGLDSSTKFQIAAANDPAEGGSGEQAKSKVNELLELEMRARAIKALLNKKPEEGEGEGDDGAEGERGDDEAAEEEEEDDGAAEQKKAMEEQKRLQKAREALMVSEAKRREEDEIREKKQEEIRQRIEAEVKRKGL